MFGKYVKICDLITYNQQSQKSLNTPYFDKLIYFELSIRDFCEFVQTVETPYYNILPFSSCLSQPNDN